jgi:hypothetical protein
VRQRRINPTEVQQRVNNNPLDLGYDTESGEERYKSLGATVRGRCDNSMSNSKREHTMAKRNLPRFQSEKEEAAWWDKNRAELDKDFVKAAREGRLKRLSKEQLSARVAAPRRSFHCVCWRRI